MRIRAKPAASRIMTPNASALIEALLGHLLQGDRGAALTEEQELSPNGAVAGAPHVAQCAAGVVSRVTSSHTAG